MKRIIMAGVLLLIAAPLAWLVYLFYPITVDFEAQGMKVRLGEAGAPEERLLAVRIKGKIYRENLKGDRRFHGTVELEGEENPVPAQYREIESMKVSGSDSYRIFYFYVDKFGRPEHYILGDLFMNDDAGKIAIAMLDQEEGWINWHAENGLMIAAPASNREEALAVSNEVMREYLNGYVLN